MAPRLVLALIVGFTSLAVGSTTHVVAANSSQLGKVRTIQHGLAVQPPHKKSHRARVSAPLFNQFALHTRARERAAIQFIDGTVLNINERTDAVLRDPRVTVVRRGEVCFIHRPGSTHTVQTAAATASAIGTVFDVRLTGARTYFVVASGHLLVRNARGSVRLGKNQQSTVLSGRAPGKPTHVNAQKLISWIRSLDGWRVIVPAGPLSEPRRIAVDPSGNLYVSDQFHNRVAKFSGDGKLLAAWGTAGQHANDNTNQFISPFGIKLDAAGNIYVADEGRSEVFKLSPSGQPLQVFGFLPQGTTPGTFIGCQGVALDGQGNVYVADTDNNRIVKLAPDGTVLATFGGPGSGPGQFSLPTGIVLDAAGNMYVADSINNRIEKLSPTGAFLAQWGTKGTAPGQFDGPTDVTLDAAGNIYVADAGNNRVQKLSPAGRPLRSWGAGGTGVGQFISLEGVALDTQGNLFAVDRSNGRIEELLAATFQ